MTNLGRLGLAGFVIFLILFIVIARFLVKFCRRYFPSPLRKDSDLICFGIVLAGMVNGVLQATYEIPHSAITHWVCLAYLAVRYYRPSEGLDTADGALLEEERADA